MAAVEAVVIGAGLRGGEVYGRYAVAHPDRLRVVAVAEPDPGRREAMARAHGLAPDAVFDDWAPLLDGPRRAPVAIVATGDTQHVEPALRAVETGHHLLLEKPIAPEPLDCIRVVEAAERAGRMLQIGHVLRYTPFYEQVHALIRSGRVGRVLHVAMAEHVAHWHMAHSYVRGKFRNREIAAPLVLAKSCHDLDLLVWLVGSRPARVASFGGRDEFRAERAPEGAPERCTDGCPAQDDCPYDAVRFYLGPDDSLARFFPWADVSPDPSREARRRALETGRYGRCVYRCDNDQPDHQAVSVEFEDGASAQFTVHGLATQEERTIRVTGTRGELRGALHAGEIEVTRHGALEVERIACKGSMVGHYGGDEGLIDHFVDVVSRGATDEVRASGRSALDSHLLGFAAEDARLDGEVVELADWRAALEEGRA
jgi:predicted dehydrogenase